MIIEKSIIKKIYYSFGIFYLLECAKIYDKSILFFIFIIIVIILSLYYFCLNLWDKHIYYKFFL